MPNVPQNTTTAPAVNPTYDIDVLQKKSPNVTVEELQQAPKTKSPNLIGMLDELKDIVLLKNEEAEAIKTYTTEVKKELEESLEVKKHEDEISKKLKEVLAKNADLATRAEKIIRLSDTEVLWLDKTYPQITELDKLSVEDKTKYEMLKKEIEEKTKAMNEIKAKVTHVSKIMSNLRLVIMKHAAKVSSALYAADVLDNVIKEYDEINGMLGSAIESIKSFIKSIADWFKGLFNK